MRKKRRAKPSGSTVKVGRVKKTKQHVKVVPVLLPGARDATRKRRARGYTRGRKSHERRHRLGGGR